VHRARARRPATAASAAAAPLAAPGPGLASASLRESQETPRWRSGDGDAPFRLFSTLLVRGGDGRARVGSRNTCEFVCARSGGARAPPRREGEEEGEQNGAAGAFDPFLVWSIEGKGGRKAESSLLDSANPEKYPSTPSNARDARQGRPYVAYTAKVVLSIPSIGSWSCLSGSSG